MHALSISHKPLATQEEFVMFVDYIGRKILCNRFHVDIIFNIFNIYEEFRCKSL